MHGIAHRPAAADVSRTQRTTVAAFCLRKTKVRGLNGDEEPWYCLARVVFDEEKCCREMICV